MRILIFLISMYSLVIIAAVFLLSGCGQKGPLYLRDSPPPGIKPPKAEPYKPVPYPKEPESRGASGND